MTRYDCMLRGLALILPFTIFACAAETGSIDQNGTGGTTMTAGGTTGSGGSVSSTGGVSSGTGGAATGGSTSSGGAATGGVANTGGSTTSTGGAVSADLPYTENWDDGDMNGWIPSDSTLASVFSVIASDKVKSLQFQSGSGECILVGGNIVWTDVHLSLKMKIVSGSPTVVIAVRVAGVKNYYYIELGDGHFKIRDRDNGASDILPTGSAPSLTTGQWYTVDFVIKGSAATGSLDGAVVATGTFNSTTPLPNGGIGIGARSGSTGVVLFDDISVTAP